MFNARWLIGILILLTIGYDRRTHIKNVASLEASIQQSTIHMEGNKGKSFARTVSSSSLSSSSTSLDEVDDGKEKLNCEAVNACNDKMGYEAIHSLHQQLDDDANGNIDIAESDEFLRDELQYENGYDRQKGFHRNDKYISVDELWQSWAISEVHNWTVEETIEWLVSSVELPQYVKNFQENAVDGTTLPRMAVSNMHFLGSILGIKDPIHKHKIALKAMDVVLFGPPRYHNYLKDVLLVFSLVIAIGGCWFAFVQHKYAQTHIVKMMIDMESLQRAEESLQEVQKQLDKAKMEHEYVVREKRNLEQRLQEEQLHEQYLHSHQNGDGISLYDLEESKIHQLEQQLQTTREELERAEKALESRSWVPPVSLQHWLQMTHELELKHYNAKKCAAEQQLFAAKEGCEKLRKRRSSFLGAFRIAHGGSIDDVDNRILQAKAALSEVTKDLQERLHRWRQIELLCGFPIVVNPGLLHLESLLQRSLSNGTSELHLHSTAKSIPSNDSNENFIYEENGPPSYISGASAGSLSSISSPTGPFRRTGLCLDIRNDILTEHSYIRTAAELKHCSSSNAILQMNNNNILSNEHLSHMGQTEEEYEERSLDSSMSSPSISSPSFSLGGMSPDGVRPNFTVGDSPQESLPPDIPTKKMMKSHSQDNYSAINKEMSQKLSYSESCLNSGEKQCILSTNGGGNLRAAEKIGRRKKSSNLTSVFRNNVVETVLDEEATTDSSFAPEEEGQKEKKKKSFLQLKKKKTKVS